MNKDAVRTDDESSETAAPGSRRGEGARGAKPKVSVNAEPQADPVAKAAAKAAARVGARVGAGKRGAARASAAAAGAKAAAVSAEETARAAAGKALRWAGGLSLKSPGKIRNKIEATLRSSAQLVQTEVDKALLNLHHPGATRLIERLASTVREPLPLDGKDFPLGLGRSVLARAQRISQEIRQGISDLSPSGAHSAKSAAQSAAGSSSGKLSVESQEPSHKVPSGKAPAEKAAKGKKHAGEDRL